MALIHSYGFRNVVTPGDILTAYPSIWPFSQNFAPYYESHARPLPRPLASPDSSIPLSKTLKIDAIFIFNDPRDWALDTQIIIDLLLSHAGHLGTLSKLNGDTSLPNNGYQQDEQPPLYFSNPDLWWAAAYHLPRLGQGGYREALEGVWRAVTGGEGQGIELQKTMFGKPHKITFAFAENKLANHRLSIFGHGKTTGVLKRVYMVGGG